MRRAVRAASLFTILFAATTTAAEKPAAVVVIVADQVRYEYLQRFSPWFTDSGFKRLAREGASFTKARPRHAVTSTGPGHAAIGGGTVPAENGIVANRWLERDGPVDRARWQAYFDETAVYRAPGTAAAAMPERGWWSHGSPRAAASADPLALEGGSLSDVVAGKVISLALTDRAAILMGGRGADAAYWFDGRAGRFVSSPYYRAASEAVLAFNELVPGYMPASAEWRPLRNDLSRATFDPPAAWPLKNTTYGGTFPHAVPTIRALQYTPFAHAMLLDFAQHVLAVESPDLLFVGISSTDYLGHLYGPDSMEVADSMIRLDAALSAFLDALERRYGERVLVVFTSDHGVQSIPEVAKLRDAKAGAGRVDLRNAHADARTIRELSPARIEIERRLARRLGVPFSLDTPLEEAFVYFFEEATLYLNPRHRTARVKRALRNVVRELDGVAGAWTSDEPLPPLVRNSYHPERSGDVLLTLRPGWIWHWGSNSTTHGQPVEADLHVPLIFWGAGVIAGTYDVAASPLDIAATLGAILGVRAGGRESRVLPCVSR
jgi:predicted AlkP superfamily pyrophosphatase or phosphodiesterase